MGRWTREELENAFDAYKAAALKGGTTGDWTEWANCFTEDCTYKEHLYGEIGGRAAVLAWMAVPSNARGLLADFIPSR